MNDGITHLPTAASSLAFQAACAIHDSFNLYQAEFMAITRRAKTRFEQQDWPGMQTDAAARLDLYNQIVDRLVATMRQLLTGHVAEKEIWQGMKRAYADLIANRNDRELAETFFNSVTRRIFTTVGVDAAIEFVDTDFDQPLAKARPVCQPYARMPIPDLLAKILTTYHFAVPYEDLSRDVALVTQEIQQYLRRIGARMALDGAEMVQPVFFRGKAAYLVGHLFSGIHTLPLALALRNTPLGVMVDAVLLEEDDVSILFSFAHSYFHVEVERPYDLVAFLSLIMPRKRIAELYIAIGYNKHGKTALYRDILNHLAYTTHQFEIAQGEKGMVMTVFDMPGYDLVFKLIKDRFAYPKRTTHAEVRHKYRLVFRHDRVGRLVDAQEFEFLKFQRYRFTDELVQELSRVASRNVTITDTHVIVHHAYVERRVTPLNLYIYQVAPEAAQAAVIEYGNAIKDMAAANIFPGDLWLKNFGVTRHGRVVFYDYDELTWLTDCNFRKLPLARHYDDELSDTPTITVADNDVFPEEFKTFLGFPPDLLQVFLSHHADLLDVHFWREYQARHRRGESIHFYPYGQGKRLRPM